MPELEPDKYYRKALYSDDSGVSLASHGRARSVVSEPRVIYYLPSARLHEDNSYGSVSVTNPFSLVSVDVK
jgi:hypothetical protein